MAMLRVFRSRSCRCSRLCSSSASPLPLLRCSTAVTTPPPPPLPLLLLRPRWFSEAKPPVSDGRGRRLLEEEEEYAQVPSDEDDSDGWEEEEEEEGKEPKIGDGGDGGGIVLGDVPWGQRALSIAQHLLHTHFQEDGLCIFAFRISPKGYIYVRLDKLSHKYGCPSMDEIEHFHRLYDECLEESGKHGEIPDNLAVEVSSPGAARLLRVPDDLERFKELPLVLKYLERDADTELELEKDGVFFLVSIDKETEQCVWKLADVKENRDPLGKGRKLTREKREWRLNLPFQMVSSVTFYINF